MHDPKPLQLLRLAGSLTALIYTMSNLHLHMYISEMHL